MAPEPLQIVAFNGVKSAMTDLISRAKARIQELQAELVTLTQFVDSAEAAERLLSGGVTDAPVSQRPAADKSINEPAIVTPITSGIPLPDRSPRVQGNPRPAVVIPAAIEILRERGYPLSRRQLHEALEKKGIVVRGADPIKAFGTMLWRASDEIINVEGRGYWPKGDPVPKIGIDELLS